MIEDHLGPKSGFLNNIIYNFLIFLRLCILYNPHNRVGMVPILLLTRVYFSRGGLMMLVHGVGVVTGCWCMSAVVVP